MRRLMVVVFVAAVLTGMSGCGGGGSVTLSGGQTSATGGTQGLTAGNWLLTAVSQVPDQNGNNRPYTYIRGALPSANSVAATLRPSAGCLTTYTISGFFPDPVPFSGSISGNSITLTSASVNGAVTTITGTIANGTNITGTYTSVGGPNSYVFGNSLCNGDQGTIYGTLVPAITGTWTASTSSASGPLANYAPDPIHGGQGPTYCGGNLDPATCGPNPAADTISVTASVLQATTANSDGSFPLSGTVTLQASTTSGNALSCYTSGGTIDSTNSYIQGDSVNIVVNANGPTVQLSGNLANPSTAIQMGARLGSGTLGLMSLSSTACTSSQFVAYGILKKS